MKGLWFGSFEDHVAQAAIEKQRPQRGDNRRDVEGRHQEAVEETQPLRHGESHRNGRHPEVGSRLEGRHHAGDKRRHRADREVDPSRHQDGRHAELKDEGRRGVDDEIVEIPARRLRKILERIEPHATERRECGHFHEQQDGE